MRITNKDKSVKNFIFDQKSNFSQKMFPLKTEKLPLD